MSHLVYGTYNKQKPIKAHQLTDCKHRLDIVGNITENSSESLLLVLLRLEGLDLHTLNDRLMYFRFRVVEYSAIL